MIELKLFSQLPATPTSNEGDISNTNLVTGQERSSENVRIRTTSEKLYSAGHSGNIRYREENNATISRTNTFGLLTALSLHSSIEGLAIGVQDSAAKVIIQLRIVI